MKIFLKTAAVVVALAGAVVLTLYLTGVFDKTITGAYVYEFLEEKTSSDMADCIVSPLSDKNKKLTKNELSALFEAVYGKVSPLSGEEEAKKKDLETVFTAIMGDVAAAENAKNCYFAGEKIENVTAEKNLTIVATGENLTISNVNVMGRIIIFGSRNCSITVDKNTTGVAKIISSENAKIQLSDVGMFKITLVGKADISGALDSVNIGVGSEAAINGNVSECEVNGGRLNYLSGVFGEIKLLSAEAIVEKDVVGREVVMENDKSRLNLNGKVKTVTVHGKYSLVNVKGNSVTELIAITEKALNGTVVIEKGAVTETVSNVGNAVIIDNRSQWDGRI